MKKYLLLLILNLCLGLSAQKFSLTPNGFRSASDSAKNFIIVDVPNKSASQIYDLVKLYIAKTSLHQPRVFLVDIPDKFIRTRSYSDNIADYKNLAGNTITLDGDFVTTFEFKNNKVKITLLDLYLPNNGATPILLKSFITHPRIFNEDGSESKTYLGIKTSLEGFVNSKLSLLKNYLLDKNNDW